MKDSTFITRVVLENYKSIASCDVRLGPLNFLVGPNGAGKSNFLDALRFVGEALRLPLDQALRNRRGFSQIVHRPYSPRSIRIYLEFNLSSGATGHYSFTIKKLPDPASLRADPLNQRLHPMIPQVVEEDCEINFEGKHNYFHVSRGEIDKPFTEVPPPASTDRLYLVNASGYPEFRPVYDALSQMVFYHFNPETMRGLTSIESSESLAPDGKNLANVITWYVNQDETIKERIIEYLGLVTPGVVGISTEGSDSEKILGILQKVAWSEEPQRFLASSVSDGTLNVLAILVALFHWVNGAGPRPTLIGLEDPEAALHPGAAELMMGSLANASEDTQILVTTHSPDLLDSSEIDAESILAIVAENGVTRIGPIDDASRSMLKEKLYTAGELMRIDQLAPR